MGIGYNEIYPSLVPLKEFSKDMVLSIGAIMLPIMARKVPFTSTTITYILIIKASSSYNIILRCPNLNNLTPSLIISR